MVGMMITTRRARAMPLALAIVLVFGLPMCWLTAQPGESRHRLANRRIAVHAGAGATQGSLELVTNTMCPFAQKAWVALEESGLSYDTREISLYGAGGKPDWFLRLNPKGEIPVLVTENGVPIVDSENILSWVESKTHAMKPQDEALGGQWRRCVSGRVAPSGKRYVFSGSASDKAELHAALAELDGILQKSDGDFAAGTEFSVADAAAVPFVQRLASEFGLPKETPHLQAWWETVQARPGVKRTLQKRWWWWW